MDQELLGFKKFCEEGIFFTHAYAPSSFSPSTLASVFTGKYPFKHSLSGPQKHLSEESQTINERLLARNINTALFSTGLPIVSKTGLDQGVNKFVTQTSFNKSDEPLYVFDRFKDWYKENSKTSFLATLYINNFLYKFPHKKQSQKSKNQYHRKIQIKNVSQNLWQLYQLLQKNRMWDSINIILVGLNGVNNKADQVKLTNHFSENLRVPLLIKPVRKKRDLALNWKVDKNISLVDVGHYLQKIYSLKIKPFPLAHDQIIDLSESVNSPKSNWSQNRSVYTYLNYKNKNQQKKVTIRSSYNLYEVYKNKISFYNSLIDRSENVAQELVDGSQNYLKLVKELRQYGIDLSIHKEDSNKFEVILTDFVKTFWFLQDEVEFWPLEFLYQHSIENKQFKSYFEYWALLNRKIEILNHEVFSYERLFDLNKGKVEIDLLKEPYKCIYYFLNDKINLFKDKCRDQISQWLWKYKTATDKKTKVKIKNKLLRSVREIYNQNKLKIINVANGFTLYGFSHNSIHLHWVFMLNYLDNKDYQSLFTDLQ